MNWISSFLYIFFFQFIFDSSRPNFFFYFSNFGFFFHGPLFWSSASFFRSSTSFFWSSAWFWQHSPCSKQPKKQWKQAQFKQENNWNLAWAFSCCDLYNLLRILIWIDLTWLLPPYNSISWICSYFSIFYLFIYLYIYSIYLFYLSIIYSLLFNNNWFTAIKNALYPINKNSHCLKNKVYLSFALLIAAIFSFSWIFTSAGIISIQRRRRRRWW